MKNNLTIALIVVLLTQTGKAQNLIGINDASSAESSYGPAQLIEEVLIGSDCVTVGSFSSQVSGFPTSRTTKSYGYFKRGQADFPFEEGIVLTTGQAFSAGNNVNPNIVQSVNNLPADTDVENALSVTNSFDATFIKFSFVPLSNTVSFRFLMASEEYDGFECAYSDGFAFLLREVGTVNYTNLAVLPDNTTVSVTNINNSSLQPTGTIPICDANVAYFEGYHLGATNYNGRTKVLTASASVTPNTEYEIKLVVADQNDPLYDSAIFLEAGSFSAGMDLGEDRIIASGDPVCAGTSVVLDTNLDIPGAIYQWYKDGVVLPGETNATLPVTDNGTYTVELGGCSDEIVIEFVDPRIVNPPENILICEPDTDLIEVFDFTNNKNLVLGGQKNTNVTISYHATQTEAEMNVNVLALPYTNTAPNETIWLRLADLTQTCFEVASFTIEVQSGAIANAPSAIDLCSFDDDGFGLIFDLAPKIDEVLGAQSPVDFEVTFYNSQFEADAGVTGTDFTSLTTISNPQRVYARVNHRSSTVCYATTYFNVEVYKNPMTHVDRISLEECEIDNDGIDLFDLSLREGEIVSGQDPAVITFDYYENEGDAIAGNTNIILDPEHFENTQPNNQTVYARVNAVDNSCFQIVPIVLTVNQAPQIQIENEYVLCLTGDESVLESTGNELLPVSPIDTRLSLLDYSFQWYRGNSNNPLELELLPGETNATFLPTRVGDYTVIATDLFSGCTIPASTLVIGSYPPESIAAEVITDTFTDANSIEVTVVGNGEYEYRLDDGPWQFSPTFETTQLVGLEHIIFVRDIYNCNTVASQNISVIDYPKFFTPNGDTFNDVWQIALLNDELIAKIYIYDRYGRLLEQLMPDDVGWDGTANGGPLPSADYWFAVEYTEPNSGVNKVFRSHFTLKR